MTNDPAIIAGAVVVVLAALGAMVVQIINAVSASRDRREAAAERLTQLTISKATSATVQETARKTDEVIGATTKIHELTNSTNSNLQKALEIMKEKVEGLEKIIAELRIAKVDTATAQALTDQRTSMLTPSPTTLPSGPAEVLVVNTPDDPAIVKDAAKAK